MAKFVQFNQFSISVFVVKPTTFLLIWVNLRPASPITGASSHLLLSFKKGNSETNNPEQPKSWSGSYRVNNFLQRYAKP